MVSPRLSRRSNVSWSSTSLPASILEKSRMSLMTDSRASPDSRTVVRKSRCCGESWLSSTSSVMPMMAFKGVRISWLMLARKALLARLAASAASLAIRNASAACLRSVMSREMPKVPTTRPSSSQQRHLGGHDPGRVPVGPRLLLLLVDHGLAGAEDLLLVRQRLPGMLLGEEVPVALADGLASVGQSEKGGHRPVDADEPALGVLEVDVVGEVVHQGVQQVAFPLDRRLRHLCRCVTSQKTTCTPTIFPAASRTADFMTST